MDRGGRRPWATGRWSTPSAPWWSATSTWHAGGGRRRRAARAPAEHLRSDDHTSVDDRPASFQAFVRSGGDVGLHAADSAALADRYDRHRPASVLDVGRGDGAALLPAGAWARQPEGAGRDEVVARPLLDHRSSPAVLPTARGGTRTA